jgi:hypothetical protein
MKNFMFIFRGGETMEDASPETMQAHFGKWKAWIDEIAAKGKYSTGDPLVPGGAVVSGADKKITDGPFAEGKELIGGYFIIKAESLEDAIEISKDCPDLEMDGSVEIREIMEVNM